MNMAPIIFYCLSSISLLITSFILLISLRQKIYRIFLNHLMVYILISEVLNMAVQYLSFARNACFSDLPITKKCRTPDTAAHIQSIFEIFSEMLTITAALSVSLKISDSFSLKTHLFKKKWVQKLTLISIIALSLIVSLAMGLYQYFHYDINIEDPTIETGKCLVINCHLARSLIIVQVSIMVFIILLLCAISGCNYAFLKKQSKRLSFDNDIIFSEPQAANQIKKALKRIMILPLVTLIIYLLLYFDRIVKVLEPQVREFDGKLYTISGYLFGVTNGLKGTVFSGVIVFIVNELKDSVLNFFKSKAKNDENIKIPLND